MIELIRKVILSGVLIAAASTSLHAQDGLSIEPVKDGLCAIFGSGGNISVIRSGVPSSQASDRIRDSGLSGTTQEDGLFIQRRVPGLYDEIVAELQP